MKEKLNFGNNIEEEKLVLNLIKSSLNENKRMLLNQYDSIINCVKIPNHFF